MNPWVFCPVDQSYNFPCALNLTGILTSQLSITDGTCSPADWVFLRQTLSVELIIYHMLQLCVCVGYDQNGCQIMLQLTRHRGASSVCPHPSFKLSEHSLLFLSTLCEPMSVTNTHLLNSQHRTAPGLTLSLFVLSLSVSHSFTLFLSSPFLFHFLFLVFPTVFLVKLK